MANVPEAVTSADRPVTTHASFNQKSVSLLLNEKQPLGPKVVVILYPITLS